MRMLLVTFLVVFLLVGMLGWHWHDLVPHSPPRFQVGDVREGAYANVVYARRITKVSWVAPPIYFLVGGKGHWRYHEVPVERTSDTEPTVAPGGASF